MYLPWPRGTTYQSGVPRQASFLMSKGPPTAVIRYVAWGISCRQTKVLRSPRLDSETSLPLPMAVQSAGTVYVSS